MNVESKVSSASRSNLGPIGVVICLLILGDMNLNTSL